MKELCIFKNAWSTMISANKSLYGKQNFENEGSSDF